MDLKWLNERINYYVRPQTYAFAIRMCTSEAEIPENAFVPTRDLGNRMLPCHAFARSRRFGQTVAVGVADAQCPYGEVVLGFQEATPEFFAGDYTTEYLCTREAAAKTAGSIVRLEYGRYSHMLTAPLDKAEFEPHIIAIYCDGAQLMRLIQGALRGKGGAVTARSMGAFGCSSVVALPMTDGECHFHIPGGAERMSALCQDHEVAFVLPAGQANDLIEGLKGGAQVGFTDYPIRGTLGKKPGLPKSYLALWEHLHANDPEAKA